MDDSTQELNPRSEMEILWASFPKTLIPKTNSGLAFDHPYPPMKLMFHLNPMASMKAIDILVSSSNYLRLLEVREASTEPISTLNNNETISVDGSAWIFDLRDKEHPQSCTRTHSRISHCSYWLGTSKILSRNEYQKPTKCAWKISRIIFADIVNIKDDES
nr:WDR1 [Ipomoea batatas]